MSEQPVAPPRPKGKTYGGLSRNQWLIVGGVFVAAVGYILWKRHQAAAASTSASTTTSTSASTAATLAAIEAQLQNLQAQGYSGGSAGSGGGGYYGGYGGAASTGSGTVTPASTTTATAPGTPVATSGTTTATATKAGAISNLQSSSVGTTTATIRWNPASNASQGYAYKVTQLNGVVVKSGNTNSTSVSLSGLHPGWTYNFGVQGLPGGPGDNIHFTTKST